MQFGMDSLMIGFDQTSLCVIKEMPDKKLKKVTHHNLRLDKYFLQDKALNHEISFKDQKVVKSMVFESRMVLKKD